MRGATRAKPKDTVWIAISIHAPHAGSDHFLVSYKIPTFYFNPRSPCGERPTSIPSLLQPFQFQSTLPMRGATHEGKERHPSMIISIHAPHAGSDVYIERAGAGNADFNPRSPCGERLSLKSATEQLLKFQSTLPMRGATRIREHRQNGFIGFQSTLPMRGATTFGQIGLRLGKFQSTLPMRGATRKPMNVADQFLISIHAPHAGSDMVGGCCGRHLYHFNPRSPCGERQENPRTIRHGDRFQSTLPMRGATH